jgi:hypothetical protein
VIDGTEMCVVRVCSECGVHWYAEEELPRCTNANHQHREFEIHRHRDAVTFPDGTLVVAVSFDARDPYRRDEPPDYGLYFDQCWQPPWPHDRVEWPDFGVPDDPTALTNALRSLRDRARAGDKVEIGCLGGHGRTGTALACLAVLDGQAAPDAIAWVRSAYCAEAVETPEQAVLVSEIAALHGP